MRFQTIHEFIEFTVNRHSKGRFGLDQFRKAMEALGNPQLRLKVIHVAGTNGKGSTTNFLRSIYQEQGYVVGSFTSPHLEVHNDRIRINDVYISDEDLLRYGNHFYDFILDYDLSMFEIDVLIAVHYFLEKKVDLAIVEVGLGGRLDATNLVDPLLSVITTIGYDHMDILGHSLEEIAYEKAGIIKDNRPIICGETKENCIEVLKFVAKEHHSTYVQAEEPQSIVLNPTVEFKVKNLNVKLSSLALYQANNASLALQAALYLQSIFPLDITKLLYALSKASWKGRFEVMSTQPFVIIDGAHNDHGMSALVESTHNLPHPRIAVFTALKDKDTDAMIQQLLRHFDEVIVTHFDFYRAQTLEGLAKDFKVTAIEDPYQAICRGLHKVKSGCLVITGSLYFISLVRNDLLPRALQES